MGTGPIAVELCCLFNLVSRAPLRLVFDKVCTSEHKLNVKLIRMLKKNDLLLIDSGFYYCATFIKILARKAHFLIPAKANHRLKVLRRSAAQPIRWASRRTTFVTCCAKYLVKIKPNRQFLLWPAVGITQSYTVLALAILGKSGYNPIKERIFNSLKKHGTRALETLLRHWLALPAGGAGPIP